MREHSRLYGLILRLSVVAVVLVAAIMLSGGGTGISATAGGKIVFNVGTSIYTINPDGSGMTLLPTNGLQAGWSPDGNKIVFNQGPGINKIWTMNSNGSGAVQLTPGYDEYPYWQPGPKILFSRDSGPNYYDIWTVNPDGTIPTKVTNNPGQDSWANWTPDGSRILFGNNSGASNPVSGIYSINANGTGQTQLFANQPGSFPVLSPTANVIDFIGPGYAVWTMMGDGSGAHAIAGTSTGGITAGTPHWSPDGSQIAYTSPSGIVIMNPDGSSPAVIPGTAGAVTFDWYPTSLAPTPCASACPVGGLVDLPTGGNGGSNWLGVLLIISALGIAAVTARAVARRKANARDTDA